VSFLEAALGLVVLVVPALIGVFWGAPLIARELETGTFRLAWTQSVTRTRWLAVKLGVVGLGSVIVAGLMSLLVTWWEGPSDRTSPARFELLLFSERGTTPIGYALFAFALGVTAGVPIRRVQPAMVATFVAFIAARLAVVFWVRPHFMAPAHMSLALTSPEVSLRILGESSGPTVGASMQIPDAWVYSTQIVDQAGHAPTVQFLQSIFPNLRAGPGPNALAAPKDLQGAVAKLAQTYHALVTYQPAGRYWAFQGLETAVFAVLALVLAGICMWWVRRRLT
jgi:hypothetical protein